MSLKKKKPLIKPLHHLSVDTLEGRAREGMCAPSLVAHAKDIPAVVSESLPAGEYCTLGDFISALKKISGSLKDLHLHPSRTLLMVNRQDAIALILTLVLAEQMTEGLLNSEFEPGPAIRASHHELEKVTTQVKNILLLATEKEMSIEDFRSAINATANSKLAEKVLTTMRLNAPKVHSTAGPIDLELPKGTVKDLPSNRVHELEVMVTGGFDDRARKATVTVLSLRDADPTLFSIDRIYEILCLDDEQRFMLIIAQGLEKPLRIKVSVPRVPIIASATHDMSINLMRIATSDCESEDQIKGLLIQQLQLRI